MIKQIEKDVTMTPDELRQLVDTALYHLRKLRRAAGRDWLCVTISDSLIDPCADFVCVKLYDYSANNVSSNETEYAACEVI